MNPMCKAYPLLLPLLALTFLSCKKEKRVDLTGTYIGTVQKKGLEGDGVSIDTTFQNALITISSKDAENKIVEVTVFMGSSFHRRENTQAKNTLGSSATSDSRSFSEISSGRVAGDSLFYNYSILSAWGRPDYSISVRAIKQ